MSTVSLTGEPFSSQESSQYKQSTVLGNTYGMLPVLDKGYVRTVDHMGNDVKVANAAKLSFDKWVTEMSPAEANLINFLAREDHTSPFRHSLVSYVIRAPLMVARQHWKYVVGSDHTLDAWNENSRRYITEKEEFYIPAHDQWRSAPENKKQGSGAVVPSDTGSLAMQMLMDDVDRQVAHYSWALDAGICAEQARLFLPAYGLYITYMWTASVQSILHFLHQRMAHDSQKEIQDYAKAVKLLTEPMFPVTFKAFGL